LGRQRRHRIRRVRSSLRRRFRSRTRRQRRMRCRCRRRMRRRRQTPPTLLAPTLLPSSRAAVDAAAPRVRGAATGASDDHRAAPPSPTWPTLLVPTPLPPSRAATAASRVRGAAPRASGARQPRSVGGRKRGEMRPAQTLKAVEHHKAARESSFERAARGGRGP